MLKIGSEQYAVLDGILHKLSVVMLTNRIAILLLDGDHLVSSNELCRGLGHCGVVVNAPVSGLAAEVLRFGKDCSVRGLLKHFGENQLERSYLSAEKPGEEDRIGFVCCPLRIPFPILAGESTDPDPFGVIYIFGRNFNEQPNDDDIKLLARFADRIAAFLWGSGVTDHLAANE